MFKLGTGWLGWTPEVTLNTPIPQILLAFDGKVDFIVKTNPFGDGKSGKGAKANDVTWRRDPPKRNSESHRAAVAGDLASAFRSFGKRSSRAR